MNSKIEKSFRYSQFYRNYNNIDHVILKFEKIKNEYTESKNNYKNNLISIVNALNKNQIIIKILNDKNVSIINGNNIDEHKLNSCKKILNVKINISHNIKKYFKYSENVNEIFIKSVEIGNIKNINFLIRNGANIHYKNDVSFLLSSSIGHTDVVKFLVKKGVDVHTNNEEALKLSSLHGHIEVVKFLIEKGADIHINDDFPLILSCMCEKIEVVKYLIEKGANIRAMNDYALRCSSENGNIEIIKILIENGSNIHAMNDEALQYSDVRNYIDVIKILINSDLEYFSKNEFARNVVINHNLIEFYEKFNIK